MIVTYCDWCRKNLISFHITVSRLDGKFTTSGYNSVRLCDECMFDVRIRNADIIFDAKSHERPQ